MRWVLNLLHLKGDLTRAQANMPKLNRYETKRTSCMFMLKKGNSSSPCSLLDLHALFHYIEAACMYCWQLYHVSTLEMKTFTCI